MNRAYESDINNKQWKLTSEYFKQKRVFGRPIKHDRRTILNGILYVTKSGCQWRMMMHDFPPFGAVYDYYRRWCEDGTWERVLDGLTHNSYTSLTPVANSHYCYIYPKQPGYILIYFTG